MRLKIEKIKIPQYYLKHEPNKKKLQKCRNNLDKGIWDRDLVVDENNVLLDGYVLYSVLQERGYDGFVNVVQKFDEVKTYIYAKHPGNDKEYVWRVPKNKEDKFKAIPNELILVNTSKGIAPAIVTRIIKTNIKPSSIRIKTVCCFG